MFYISVLWIKLACKGWIRPILALRSYFLWCRKFRLQRNWQNCINSREYSMKSLKNTTVVHDWELIVISCKIVANRVQICRDFEPWLGLIEAFKQSPYRVAVHCQIHIFMHLCHEIRKTVSRDSHWNFKADFMVQKNFFWVKNFLSRKPEVLSKSLVLTVYFWF